MLSTRNIFSALAMFCGAAAFTAFLWSGDQRVAFAALAAAVGFLGAANVVG